MGSFAVQLAKWKGAHVIGTASARNQMFLRELGIDEPIDYREEVMRYLSQRYFKFAPKLHYDARPHDVRIFGDALWYSYDFWIDTPEERLTGHGMSMCRKDAGGRWRILNVHNSVKEAADGP